MSVSAATVPVPPAAPFERRGPSFWAVVWQVIRRKPSRLLGLVIIIFFAGMAVIGPALYPSTLPTDVSAIYAPPSLSHPLGTDFEGTDVFALIVTGSRSSRSCSGPSSGSFPATTSA